MPYGEADDEDPMELVGVEMDATEESVKDMIACYAEEYARMGFCSEQILEIFQNPAYPPAYGAMQQIGERFVRERIAEAVFIYGRREG